jgi:hypothetical protein
MKNLMNQGKTMLTAAFLLLFAAACGSGGEENAQNETGAMEVAGEVDEGVHHDGIEEGTMQAGEMQPFLSDYMEVKDALVNDNYEQVKQAVSDMRGSLEGSEFSDELDAGIQALANAPDIEAQRQAFAQLSQQLYQVVQNNDVTDKALYWQHCPMAMNNAGANWLSFEKQVQNPFMGQRMPGCGSVQETLNN